MSRTKRTKAQVAAAEAAAAPAAVTKIPRRGSRHTLEDGSTAPYVSRAKKRKRERDDDVRSISQDVRDIVNSDRAYQAADMLRPGKQGGRPSTFPPELYSVLWSLVVVFSTVRAMQREVGRNDSLRSLIWDGVLARVDDPDEVERLEAELAASATQGDDDVRPFFPTRTSIARAFRRIDTETSGAILMRGGLEISTENGYLDTDRQGGGSAPDRRDCTYTDGTVHRTPSDVTEEWAVDPTTMQPWRRRIDHEALEYTEGGDVQVRGMKSTQVLIRGATYRDDIFLAIAVEPSPSPTAEATRAMDMHDKIIDELTQMNEVTGDCGERPRFAIQAAAYDGAPSSDHHDRALEHGMVLASPPPAKLTAVDPDTRIETRIDHIHDLGDWSHKHATSTEGTCAPSRLVAINGQIHLQETVKGKPVHTPLQHTLKVVWRNGRRYLYIIVQVHCRKERMPGTVSISMQRSTYMKTDASGATREAVYERILRGVRVWPSASENGRALKGLRQSVEAKHSVWDEAWPGRRIPAWSNHMRLVLLHGWAHGNNILVEARLARARDGTADLARAG